MPCFVAAHLSCYWSTPSDVPKLLAALGDDIPCEVLLPDQFLQSLTDYRKDKIVLEPIEPPQQGDITLPELFDKAGESLCLVGHIQDQELHYVPSGAMTRKVEEIARRVNGRTGYIMTPTCAPFQHPASDVFLRNYAEWIEAADRLLS